jgi:hypothetical protein
VRTSSGNVDDGIEADGTTMVTRRGRACRIADANAGEDFAVHVLKFADGVVVLLRDREEIAFRVLEECQQEHEESAIGWSQDRHLHCVVCPAASATNAVVCRLAEEFHLFEGLESPLAAEAGIRVTDGRVEGKATIAAFVRSLPGDEE